MAAGATLLSSVFLTSLSQAALVTNPVDPRVWQGATVGTFTALYYGSDTPANRAQLIADQLLDDGVFGFAGATPATLVSNTWSNGPVSTGYSTGVGNGDYSYSSPGASSFVAANGVDEKWIQTSGIIGDTVFDLGALSFGAVVFNTIDHGPLPQEAIESSVYLSNTATGPWTLAQVKRVWLEGYTFNPVSSLNIQWDGFAYAVGTSTNTSFRYASVIHGGPGALISDGDDEINGIVGINSDFTGSNVPDGGSTLALLGLALGGVAAARRKFGR